MHKPKEDFEGSTDNPDPDFKPHALLGVTIFSDEFGIGFPIGVSFTNNASATHKKKQPQNGSFSFSSNLIK